MEKIDTKKLFQITEAAHACGLSRSTLMRLEKKGLLKPAYIAPDSGRRYYDNHNVARILQIEKFKAMGFGTEEIAGYFVRGGEAEGLLAVLEERLHSLQRSVEEMRLRATESDQFSVQMVTLPAATCCIQWHVGHTFAERYDAMYDFYSQCIREGCVLSDEPLLAPCFMCRPTATFLIDVLRTTVSRPPSIDTPLATLFPSIIPPSRK